MPEAELESSLNLILDSLPEHHGSEQRKHALTREDVKLIIDINKLLARGQACSLHFTESQARDMISMIKERRRMLALIGTMVVGLLAYIGQKTLDFMAPDLWKKLAAIFAR